MDLNERHNQDPLITKTHLLTSKENKTMKLLTVLFLSGVVDSVSEQSVTVELETRPNCDPVIQVMSRSAFPCVIREGDAFHLVKLKDESDVIVVCGSFESGDSQ